MIWECNQTPANPRARMATRLLVDSRERAVAEALQRAGVPYSQHELAVCDFEVQGPHVSWLLERKTLTDWAASIKDGRLKSQRSRAREFAEAVHPRVRLGYIVETGRVPLLTDAHTRIGGDPRQRNARGVAESALAGSIVRTTLRDGIPCYWSGSVDDTVALLQLFVRTMDIDASQGGRGAAAPAAPPLPFGEPAPGGAGHPEPEPESEPVARPTVGAKRPRNVNMCYPAVVGALLAVVGMSERTAAAVAETFPTARALVEADVDAIANLQATAKRRVGLVLAQRVKAIFS